ncbi:MAG: membrane protein insertase YidC [Corynebacterium sp.]|uniref:membrane protein insertase YidC n=1 Tax=Corynebacterium sp. TaxID=1720 RepID=UPI0026DAF6B9|nr:membrane protein insertase YidC [Corynebacterium sp.]MDO4761915.1 membrane protein insertase YidC [Corynebacterium sp.]
MLEIFIYPVSGVMKLWHLFFHSLLGLNDSAAWVYSIVGLIVVVRGIITPLQWMILKSGRISTMMRPHVEAINAEYATEVDPEKLKEMAARQKQVRKDYGYKVSAGCIPPLIQIPVFLGLYQVLLRMARPAEGLDSSTHAPIGLLTSADVSSFLEAKIGNVGLPAYIAMTPEQLEHVGTTAYAVNNFNFPLIVLAGLVTSINIAISTVRNRFSMDHDSKMAASMLSWMVVFIILTPIMLIFVGVTGPIPAAIALYWVLNNFWTLIQNVVIYIILRRVLPYEQELIDFQLEKRTQRIANTKQKRTMRWLGRLAVLGFILAPWKFETHKNNWHTSRQYFRDVATEKKEKKAAAKALKKEREAAAKAHKEKLAAEKRAAEQEAETTTEAGETERTQESTGSSSHSFEAKAQD